MENKLLNAVKAALEIENREISLQDQFKEFEEWDSLSRLSLISVIDEEFDVQIEGKLFEDISTLGQLLDAIEGKIKQQST
jgi:acyl carrier protein